MLDETDHLGGDRQPTTLDDPGMGASSGTVTRRKPEERLLSGKTDEAILDAKSQI